MRLLQWNIEGLTEAKQSCEQFTNFLSQYHVICLSETWTNKQSQIKLSGYSNPIHSYRRLQNRKAKRSSGGIIIYIKDSIRKGVKLIRNNIDCLIWLKFDKTFFQIRNDLYLGMTYVAPENSSVHNFYETDIFQTIQDDVTFFQDKGSVFLLGDLNCRTSIKSDFIENDRHIPSRDVNTEIDTPLQRYSMDRGTNRFGENLLELCKAVNMRIVNGRLHKDRSIGRMTCYTHNGESVVDYVLTSQINFNIISDFEIGDFMEYSNHAPVSLSIKTFTDIQSDVKHEHTSYNWKPEYKDAFINDITRDSPILNQIISDGIENDYEPDDIVTSFTKFITERANPYFQKRHIPNKMPAFANGNTKEKQKWYNYECSQKHARYQEALYNYNLNRNRENRMLMLDAKKDYKYFCRKCKLKYKYDQGKNMNEMRKKTTQGILEIVQK